MSSIGFDDIGGAVSKRALKIFWLVDVSGSMDGDKIATVNRAIRACIDPLLREAEDNPEAQMYVRAMKFSIGAQWHTNETKIEDFEWHDLIADGWTDTGAALKLMAQELSIERMGQRALPPVIILMSDGEATDNYDEGIKELISQRWGPKTVRIAIAIGTDANVDELSKFCSNPKETPPLVADKASTLIKYIKWASTQVPKAVTNSVIRNKDSETDSSLEIQLPPPPQPHVTIAGNDQDDWDDAIF